MRRTDQTASWRTVWSVAVAVLATHLGLPGSVAAQTGERLALGLTGATAHIRMVGFGGGDERLSGFLYGVEGRASLWRMHARAEYRQGSLDRGDVPGSGSVVTARASLGLEPVPWFAITSGPHISSVETLTGDELIVRWRVEVHGSAPLVLGWAVGFASIGGSVAGTSVDWGQPFRSTGGDVGLLVGGGRHPMWARLGYRMDRELLARGGWESAEILYLSAGISVTSAGPD
jgi:hypothetical protein